MGSQFIGEAEAASGTHTKGFNSSIFGFFSLFFFLRFFFCGGHNAVPELTRLDSVS